MACFQFVAVVVTAGLILVGIHAPQLLCIFDSAPTQVVEHFVGDSQEKGVVRLANEIQHGLPISSALFRKLPVPNLPFLEDVLHLLVGQEVIESIGNSLDELFLLLEERV